MSEWISVEDRLPETVYEDVLLVGINEFTGEYAVVYGSMYEFPSATHWQPLPPPPE